MNSPVATFRQTFPCCQAVGGRMLRLLGLLCLLAWFGALSLAHAQTPGTLDPSFNPGGSNLNGSVSALTVQSDGRVLIGGYFTAYNGVARNRLARLNADGSLDATFDPGSGLDDTVRTMAVQSDGKILIGGNFSTCNGVARKSLARLNADGSLDTTFIPASVINAGVGSLAIQSNGKVIIGSRGVIRLNADGTMDTTFNPGGAGTASWVNAVAVQIDGKIVISGYFSSYNGVARNGLARLNSDGGLDTAFNPGTGPDYYIYTLALLGTGKVVIGGTFHTYNGVARERVARLNTDGSLDTTFNPGSGAGSDVASLAVLSTGKVFIVGEFPIYNGVARQRIARLNADGTLDTAFNPGGGLNDYVDYVAVQTDGKPIVGGGFTSASDVGRQGLARFNTDGSLDTTFNHGNGISDFVYRVAVQPDGKVLVAGGFLSINDAKRRCLARLNADGTLDTTFNPGAGAGNLIYALALQADGKVLIGGAFTTFNGVARNYVARLNADGSVDTTFNPGSGASYYVYSLAVQSDGKVLVGGAFSTFNGVARKYLARLNADGSVDPAFDPGRSGLDDSVSVVAVQGNGQLFVGGNLFIITDGVRRNGIVRLNADGSLDPTFLPDGGGTFNSMTAISLPGDGKVVIAGDFSNVSDVARQGIARLNADGSVDPSFDPGTGANGLVRAVVLQNDGKMVVGGDFTTFNGVAQNYLTRLNVDGSSDAAFNPGNTVNKYVYGVALQSDGKMILAGDFTAVNGAKVARAARLYGGSVAAVPSISATGTNMVQSGSAVVRATVNPQNSATTVSFQYGLTTSYGGSTAAQNAGSSTAPMPVSATLTGLAPGTLYHYRVVATNAVGTTNGADATITTLSVSQDWRQQYFGTASSAGPAADLADPDGDGIVNVLERALGLDPKVPGTTGLPTIAWEAATNRLTLTVSKGAYTSDLTFSAEGSSDLVNWTTSGVTVLASTSTIFQVRDDAPASNRRFLRLRVTAR